MFRQLFLSKNVEVCHSRRAPAEQVVDHDGAAPVQVASAHRDGPRPDVLAWKTRRPGGLLFQAMKIVI